MTTSEYFAFCKGFVEGVVAHSRSCVDNLDKIKVPSYPEAEKLCASFNEKVKESLKTK